MKKFIVGLLSTLLLMLTIAACDTAKTATSTAAVAPKEMMKNDATAMKKFMNTIDPAQIKERLYTFASYDFEGRRTGTRGQRRAAEYLSSFYMKNDLAGPVKDQPNPYLQPINFKETNTQGGSVVAGDKTYELDKDFAILSGVSNDNTSDAVFIGYGIETEGYNDFDGLDMTGKTAVMLIGEPMTSKGERLFDFNQQDAFKEQMFSSMGISNMIITTTSQQMFNAQLPFMASGRARIQLSSGEEEDAPKFSTLFFSPEKVAEMFGLSLEEWLSQIQGKLDQKMAPGGMFKASNVSVNITKADRNTVSHNVMAYLPGTDLKDQVIVISSHYDHDGIKNGVIYPGADDDGSGTMGVMEIAQAFSEAAKAGHRPRRSMLFLNVTGEEEGLLGSQYYADVEPIFPLAKTTTNLNIDMIGRIDPKHESDTNYVYIIGSDYLSTELHATHEKVSKTYFPDMEMDFTYNDKSDPNRFYYRSDHYNFAKNNIPIIFYFNGTHDDYHQPTDTPDKINYGQLAERTKLIFATAWELANMDKAPAVDVPQE